MWRYLNTVKEPGPKRQRVQESKANYEEKRVRKFQASWLVNPAFSKWLRYDEEKKLMFCQACEAHGPPNQVFVQGCSSHRLESIQCHAASNVHIRAYEKQQALQAPTGSSEAEQMLQQMHWQNSEKLGKLFRTAHALAKHNRPFTDFVWQCELDEAKGINIGPSYRSHVKCKEFTMAIGEIERKKIEKRIQEAKFISVICDEATDTAVLEQLIVYIR